MRVHSLWRTQTRFDRSLMDQTLAPGFFEFGRSGKVYSRDQMLFDLKEAIEIKAVLPLPSFQARHITETLVQATYISEVEYGGEIERANRSSIWQKRQTLAVGIPPRHDHSLNERSKSCQNLASGTKSRP